MGTMIPYHALVKTKVPGHLETLSPFVQGGGDGERAKPTPSQQHYLELAELDEALHHG